MTGEGGSFMAEVRSGLCHGPCCTLPITGSSPSEDFCSDECQTAWNASHAHPPMPPLSINLPGPSLARWTPEGGAPITPETSTWTPRETEGWLQLDDSDFSDWGVWRGMIVPEHPAEDSTVTVTPSLPYGLRPGDLVVVMGGPSPGEYRVAEPSAKPPADTSWLKTCETPPKRSWFSRLWRWMWLRG